MRRKEQGKRIWGVGDLSLIKYNHSLVLFAFEFLGPQVCVLSGHPQSTSSSLSGPNATGLPSGVQADSRVPKGSYDQNYPHPRGLAQVSEILITFGYSFEKTAKMKTVSIPQVSKISQHSPDLLKGNEIQCRYIREKSLNTSPRCRMPAWRGRGGSAGDSKGGP